MSDHAIKRAPEWGVNYCPGYIGFTHTDKNLISAGIDYFEHWSEDYYGITVSHTFVVSGQDECIEAQAKGVVRAPLAHYFQDKHCHVYFRVPVGWHTEMGQRIIASAATHIGDGYNYGLIVANAVSNTVLGHYLGLGWVLNRLMDRKRQEICSTAVAKALNDQPELHSLGVLALPPAMIKPQDLFADRKIFVPWH